MTHKRNRSFSLLNARRHASPDLADSDLILSRAVVGDTTDGPELEHGARERRMKMEGRQGGDHPTHRRFSTVLWHAIQEAPNRHVGVRTVDLPP